MRNALTLEVKEFIRIQTAQKGFSVVVQTLTWKGNVSDKQEGRSERATLDSGLGASVLLKSTAAEGLTAHLYRRASPLWACAA